jgi:hypothetical protein
VKKQNVAAMVLGFLLLVGAGSASAAGDNWLNLTPKEKERVRRNLDRWERLPPQDKERLREEWDRWNKLPQDRRDRIKQRYDQQRRDRDRDSD